jgi:hypothetical protein
MATTPKKPRKPYVVRRATDRSDDFANLLKLLTVQQAKISDLLGTLTTVALQTAEGVAVLGQQMLEVRAMVRKQEAALAALMAQAQASAAHESPAAPCPGDPGSESRACPGRDPGAGTP